MITGSQAIIAFLEATSNKWESPYIIVGGSMEVVLSIGRVLKDKVDGHAILESQ
ncbi:MAG: hypothetical protein GQ560_01365, partial [Dehalococcoidia bacterium]|nr:hypothetical protein [Dehalococcoidia bacterium]